MQKHRAGWEYMWEPKAALGRILTLGIWDREWIRIRYPDLPSIGRLESDKFEPAAWKPEYPNPAFSRATPEDAYWGARIVMSFTDDDIRTIVETGDLSNPEAEQYLVEQLIQRRGKIGAYWFNRVNTADRFRVSDAGLGFDRLASLYGFSSMPGDSGVSWFAWDNPSGAASPIGVEASHGLEPIRLPDAARDGSDGDYFRARLREQTRTVDVYLRHRAGRIEVVGIERGSLR
jgi:hypothetical protein